MSVSCANVAFEVHRILRKFNYQGLERNRIISLRVCSARVRKRRAANSVSVEKNCRENHHPEDFGLDLKIILKRIFNKYFLGA
jgi:hypothetical protein